MSLPKSASAMTEECLLYQLTPKLAPSRPVTPRPASPDEVARDLRFYSDHVVFKVDNRLFKLPKRPFQENSEIFADMFALPTGDTPAEGQSDDNPLVLEGVTKAEFRALLHVMSRPFYGPSRGEKLEPSMEEWIMVLKLTSMWQFSRLRLAAIDALTPLLRSHPVQWVSLARRYTVGEWLFPALQALARRTQALQMRDVEPLGIETVIKMAEIRESFLGCNGPSGNYTHRTATRAQHEFGADIRRLFRDELEEFKTY